MMVICLSYSYFLSLWAPIYTCKAVSYFIWLLLYMSSSHTGDSFTRLIVKKYSAEILVAVTDIDKLANDLWCDSLTTHILKDDVINSPGLFPSQRTAKLVFQFYTQLNFLNTGDFLVAFCTVLKKQNNTELTRITDDMLNELSVG